MTYVMSNANQTECFLNVHKLRGFMAATAIAALFSATAVAQELPSGPIRIVVGFDAGGVNDSVARLVADKLTASLKHTVIVENRPGAGGIIATEMVMRAKPDGATLLLANSSFVTNPVLSQVRYDPVNDLDAVAPVTSFPLFLATTLDGPDSVAELVEQAKASPGAVTYATSGVGTSNHIGAVHFADLAGVEMKAVPYKSGSQALTSIVSGEVEVYFGANIIALSDAGKIKAVAVTTPERLPDYPDIPTVAETVPGYSITSWNGIFAPEGTPRPIIDTLNEAIQAALKSPEMAESLKTLEVYESTGSPEDLEALVASEYEKWAAVIEHAGIAAAQ